ncbi:MAG: 4Fe-4S binding protein [Planctomycetes bacterium]|nr:4Fe-4S binding protein [Planctomycetota bacterium]
MSRGRRSKFGGRSDSSRRHPRTAGSAKGAGPTSKAPRRNYARWRAVSLSLVYVAFAAHFTHWKVTGKTLAPLELNEVMYTLELGIITAGFIFMCLLILGTAIFGRFFCSWACHIIVLQDLCAWLLRKVGIRAKPIRSRLLLLVPPLTAFYMFLWPQFVRAWQSQALPTFRLASDAEGWASFVTNNFWRNLPNAPVIVLTFLVCGFAIVYFLGSRTFCTYICPYGAVFALADRFSPGRIRVNDSCQQCGTCTAACTSGIRVHEEVKLHGMIVNPACMKDLDCVSACPQQALSYGLAKPALWKSVRSGGRFGLRYDFSFFEEIVMAIVFVFVLFSFRGLYSRVPFLLSLTLGVIAGYATVVAVRLLVKPNVNFASLGVKTLGKLTGAGAAYIVGFLLLAIFVGFIGFYLAIINEY